MRRSQPTTEHAEAVSRRLATLSAELAAVRREPQAHADEQHTRVRGEIDEAPAPVVLPVPGRHASRRLSIGALQLGPVHLAVVAVVAALAVGFAAWAVVRDQARPVPVPEVEPAPTALTSVRPPAAAAASTGVEVTVDVAGKVRHPGIAVLPPGSRVVDALEAAGGPRRGVDLTSLNLARPLVDGEQILVGVAVPTGVAGTLGTPGETGPLVNLNTADLVTLETLPGVGPVTAGAIVAWRTDNGSFTSVDELLEVDGIGDATLAELAPHVTI